MRGYVIKETIIATVKHPTRSGEVTEYYYTKGGYIKSLDSYITDNECYKSSGIAERVMKKLQEETHESCWDYKYEVVKL